jgi:hypothetical protein
MRIYHAHALCTYGTQTERAERRQIRATFPKCKIVDPGQFENSVEKQVKGMKYCFELIRDCDALVFSKLLKKVTTGVGLEIRYALAHHIRVYELKGKSIRQVTKPLRYLSRKHSRDLFRTWRMEKEPEIWAKARR